MDLRSRILSGSGPDSSLDKEVWTALTGKEEIHERAALQVAPPLTASVDACIALMDEVLPGWEWEKRAIHQAMYRADRAVNVVHVFKSPLHVEVTHPDLCRAILAALTDAKAQEAG